MTTEQTQNTILGILLSIFAIVWAIIGVIYICAGWVPVCERLGITSGIVWLLVVLFSLPPSKK